MRILNSVESLVLFLDIFENIKLLNNCTTMVPSRQL